MSQNSVKLTPQQKSILELLQSGVSLTGIDALKLVGSMKLATRISELKTMGYNIQDETIHDAHTKKHYKKYWLSDEPKKTEQEISVAHSNLGEEYRLNTKEVNKQLEFAV